MDQIAIGKFIANCRKGKKMTQAQLAEKLNITDRAVSKWETGKSMPDSSIMLELCELLGITVNELLSGEKIKIETYEKQADENLIALKRKEEHNAAKNGVIFTLFSATLLIAATVCFICDIAISHSLTWSTIPAGSILYTWLITSPAILLKGRRITGTLLSLSIFTLPYLYLLSCLLTTRAVFTIGAPIAAISILFLWLIAAVITRMGKTNKLTALGITLLLLIPLTLIINVILSKTIATPILDLWDLLSFLLILLIALPSLLYGQARKKHTSKP